MSSRTFGVDNPVSVDQFRTGKGAPKRRSVGWSGRFQRSHVLPAPIGGRRTTPSTSIIELANITAAAVPLSTRRFPTNTWQIQGGVEYTFPPT